MLFLDLLLISRNDKLINRSFLNSTKQKFSCQAVQLSPSELCKLEDTTMTAFAIFANFGHLTILNAETNASKMLGTKNRKFKIRLGDSAKMIELHNKIFNELKISQGSEHRSNNRTHQINTKIQNHKTNYK